MAPVLFLGARPLIWGRPQINVAPLGAPAGISSRKCLLALLVGACGAQKESDCNTVPLTLPVIDAAAQSYPGATRIRCDISMPPPDLPPSNRHRCRNLRVAKPRPLSASQPHRRQGGHQYTRPPASGHLSSRQWNPA